MGWPFSSKTKVSPAQGDYAILLKQTKGGQTDRLRLEIPIRKTPPYTVYIQGHDLSYTVYSETKFDLYFRATQLPEQVYIEIQKGTILLVAKTLTPSYQSGNPNPTMGAQCKSATELILLE